MAYNSPIAETYGMAYLGVVFAGILYGITALQTYIYLVRFPRDRWGIKLFVIFIFILDTIHQSAITYALWFYLIDSFGKPLNLLMIHWSLQICFYLSVVVGFAVQLFYTYRIWNFTKNRLLCMFIVMFGFLYLIFGIYFGAFIQAKRQLFWTSIPQHTWSTDLSLGCSIAADSLIAVAMTVILRARSTEFDRTRSIIQILIAYAIGTGLLTVIMSLLTLIFFAVSTTFVSQLIYFMLSKFYTNAALISLNARRSLQNEYRQPLSLSSRSANSDTTAIQLANVQHDAHRGLKYPPVLHVHRMNGSDDFSRGMASTSIERTWGDRRWWSKFELSGYRG